jgi:hypothetical protein
MASNRTAFTHVVDLAHLTTSGIRYTNDCPNDQGSIGQVHESLMTAARLANGDVTLTWTYSAYLTVASGAYTVTTSSTGYGIVGVYGYQSFNLVDTYLRAEIDAMKPKIGVVRVDGSSLYLKADNRSFPAGTSVIINHYYVGSGNGSESMITLTRNSTNTTSATMIGGISASRWQTSISGTVTLTNALAKGTEILLGTLSVSQSGTTNAVARSIAYGIES